VDEFVNKYHGPGAPADLNESDWAVVQTLVVEDMNETKGGKKDEMPLKNRELGVLQHVGRKNKTPL